MQDHEFALATAVRGIIENRFLRVAFHFARKYREYSPLKLVGSIHVAGFSLVRSLPDRWGIPRRLDKEFLVFVSLFDGSASQYLSDFGALIPNQIDLIWDNCRRYPGTRNSKPFAAWIDDHLLTDTQGDVPSYSYHGYRTERRRRLVSLPMVLHSLDLRERLKGLRQRVRNLDDAARLRAEVHAVAAEALAGGEG